MKFLLFLSLAAAAVAAGSTEGVKRIRKIPENKSIRRSLPPSPSSQYGLSHIQSVEQSVSHAAFAHQQHAQFVAQHQQERLAKIAFASAPNGATAAAGLSAGTAVASAIAPQTLTEIATGKSFVAAAPEQHQLVAAPQQQFLAGPSQVAHSSQYFISKHHQLGKAVYPSAPVAPSAKYLTKQPSQYILQGPLLQTLGGVPLGSPVVTQNTARLVAQHQPSTYQVPAVNTISSVASITRSVAPIIDKPSADPPGYEVAYQAPQSAQATAPETATANYQTYSTPGGLVGPIAAHAMQYEKPPQAQPLISYADYIQSAPAQGLVQAAQREPAAQAPPATVSQSSVQIEHQPALVQNFQPAPGAPVQSYQLINPAAAPGQQVVSYGPPPPQGAYQQQPGAPVLQSYQAAPQQVYQAAQGQVYQAAPGQAYQPAPGQAYPAAPGQVYQAAPAQAFQVAAAQAYQAAPPQAYQLAQAYQTVPAQTYQAASPSSYQPAALPQSLAQQSYQQAPGQAYGAPQPQAPQQYQSPAVQYTQTYQQVAAPAPGGSYQAPGQIPQQPQQPQPSLQPQTAIQQAQQQQQNLISSGGEAEISNHVQFSDVRVQSGGIYRPQTYTQNPLTQLESSIGRAPQLGNALNELLNDAQTGYAGLQIR